MQYRLNDSLGLIDARHCNKEFAAGIPLDAKQLTKGATVELPKQAAEYLSKRYPSLLSSNTVKAVAEAPKIAAPAKSDK